jgi:ABC-2 type transport system permease protein
MTDLAVRGSRARFSVADLKQIGTQIGYEQKSYWRNPAAAFFTFAFPLVFFFILTGVAGGQTDNDLGQGVHLSQYYTPSILSYAIMSACFLSIAMNVVRKREGGILKRYRGTPLPTTALLGGFIGSAVLIALLLSVVVIFAGVVVFGVHLQAAKLPAIALIVVLAALVFCALGIAVSSLIPNDDSGPAIVNLPFFILVFISGTYFPVSGTLAKVADWFPLRPLIDGLEQQFLPGAPGVNTFGHDVLVLVIWGVASTVFAVRHFKWVPNR